jgi:hypothetical protein
LPTYEGFYPNYTPVHGISSEEVHQFIYSVFNPFMKTIIAQSTFSNTTSIQFLTPHNLPYNQNNFICKDLNKKPTDNFHNNSISQIPEKAGINCYPNPAHDYFAVDINGLHGYQVNISLYNTLGQLLLNKTFDNIQNSPFHQILNISQLPPGSILVLIKGEGIAEKRYIIKN